ncbi:GNAT family N-acetyltransferase [Ktedonobacter robiniae]|uniref:N-acetyltransferase domain-containing protein n=1 Tax=Ktedonobacter robiniae TaxID=2778365 RepID=A0ABQ3UN44_9CHLR|nr:GNAT family N-acetyltransferase [Ktedonobacter robiniae]GHO54097.1 hypothetical protein KSB_25720 [Ktedonobacter robiniae]
MQQYSGLEKRRGLAEDELNAVAHLIELCYQHDQSWVRVNVGDLRHPAGLLCQSFLYYEDALLVGYLGVEGLGASVREATGMVHPAYRRRGIFRQLLAAARLECEQQDIARLLLITEQGSESGKAFIASTGARLEMAEHEMILQQFQDHYVLDDRLLVRQAEDDDLEGYLQAVSTSFGETVERRRPLVTLFWHNPKFRFYLATFGEGEVSCREPVGCLRLDVHEAEGRIGIYSVGVIPAYRGRGYGRQMLESVLRDIPEREQKVITLDVETDNTPALHLYRSCGFRVARTYAYYALDLVPAGTLSPVE